MGYVREYICPLGSYEPFWGQLHVQRSMGWYGLVVHETLVLVAGLVVVGVIVLVTATGPAWGTCAGVAVGDEEEGAGASGGGECRGGGRGRRWGGERTHCRRWPARRRQGTGQRDRQTGVTDRLSQPLSHEMGLVSSVRICLVFEGGRKGAASRSS